MNKRRIMISFFRILFILIGYSMLIFGINDRGYFLIPILGLIIIVLGFALPTLQSIIGF